MLYSNKFIFLFQLLSFVVFLYIEKKNLKNPLFPVSTAYAAFDSFMHLCLYLILAMPLLKYRNEFIIGAFVLVFIDIDHIVKAWSFQIQKLVSLGRRPYTHSLLFAFIASAIVWFVSRNFILSYMIFTSLIIHFLRDLIEGKTYIFFPNKKISSYSFSAYVCSSFTAIIVNWAFVLICR